MRGARPLDGNGGVVGARLLAPPSLEARAAIASVDPTAVPDATQLPLRNAGRVFIRVGNFDGFCSGVAINSPSRQLVLTAGHCLYDVLPGHRRPSRVLDLVFVPAYNGEAPFGKFAGRQGFLLRPWLRRLNENYDIGAVLADPNGSGQNVADAVGGGEAIALNQPRNQAYELLGYPGGGGQLQMQSCSASFTGTIRFRFQHWAGPASSGVDCFMAEGASGGPWLIDDGAAVAGITTFGLAHDLVHTFGPYFAGRNVGRLISGL